MPLMDGYTATKIIRSKSYLTDSAPVPVLAMTADVLDSDIKRCLDAGMNDHIGKPVAAAEVIAKMKKNIAAR